MSQYTPIDESARVEDAHIANPAPLGLSVLAFVTAILGCFYAGFILPYGQPWVGMAIMPALLIGGVILVLAGMWEFRRGAAEAATLFTSYGGFLAVLGVVSMLGFHLIGPGPGASHLIVGLLFLCWTIFLGVILFGSLNANVPLIPTVGVLFLSYLFLTIGELIGVNRVLLGIGGWLAILCALVAWGTAILSMTQSIPGIKLPIGGRNAFER